MEQSAGHEKVPWHSLTADEALSRLGSSPVGLSTEEARRRLAIYGPNQIERLTKTSPIKIFLKQFANILMGLLIVALMISGFLGEVVDSIVIGIIVFFVAVVGFVQEFRAEKTLESLKRMMTPTATVMRDGREREVGVREIVVGDIVVLSTGSKVPADLRLIEAVNLQVDEAPLTGESAPVSKSTNPLPERTPLHDRVNIAFAGTTVTYGRGRGVVYATGMNTEFGKIAVEATAVEEEKTPLEARMDEVGRRFALFAVLIIVAIIASELVGEMLAGSISPTFLVEVLLFAVAMAVAVVPEALPGIVTATLAIGMGIMAKRNALVRRMPAVETLGSTQVICFDKTGTLTLNQMNVRQVYLGGRILDVSMLDGGSGPRLLARAGVLCNDASIVDEGGRTLIRGDPTEGALLLFARSLKMDYGEERKAWPRVYEVPFTSERKLMTTVHQTPTGGLESFMKGAVEVVLERCTQIYDGEASRPLSKDDREKILGAAEEMAGGALRVLALAHRRLKELKHDDVERDFTFIGLVGMMDPPRPDAVEAIKVAHMAGMRTVMVTGDHRLTALTIAREVGIYKEGDVILTGDELDDLSDAELDGVVEKAVVYARISPLHKLRIVEAWKRRGYVVAMTGDGVNDAPALKRADIGVATGITGTDVSKDASDMILADDNFATIVKAVELGRWIYENVRKYLAYLLEANLVEIIVIGAVALVISRLLGLQGEDALPLLPIHILYINLATDGLPAIALGFSPPDPDIMKRRPIPRNEPVFSWEVKRFLITVMLVATPAYLLGYLTGLQESVDNARSRLFFMFIANELVLALNCRSLVHSILKVRPHKWLWLAILWEITLITAIMIIPGGPQILRLIPPSLDDVAWMLSSAAITFTAVELSKLLAVRRGRPTKPSYTLVGVPQR